MRALLRDDSALFDFFLSRKINVNMVAIRVPAIDLDNPRVGYGIDVVALTGRLQTRFK